MRKKRPHPAAGFLLDSEEVGSLRDSVERLRHEGLTANEAAAELVRENIYDWVDSESESGAARRLRGLDQA